MNQQEIAIATGNIGCGMYISRLDRPWLDTPFLMQGFLVQDKEEVQLLRQHCEYVYIDPQLTKLPVSLLKQFEHSPSNINVRDNSVLTLPEVQSKGAQYEILATVEEELARSAQNHEKLCSTVYETIDEIKRGDKISVSSLEQSISPMVDSMLRNPDAMAWLTRIKQKDSYTYNHSLSTSITAVVFGRHLGLPKEDLKTLALGTLLFDIGKLKLSDELLCRPGKLNPLEFELVKKHVDYGVEILKKTPGVDEKIISLVWTHHERHNGKGYPNHLKGNEIPIFGRIAAIVDCYDAITSQRPFAATLSPHEAVKKLYEWREIDFQGELIEEFIQSIGTFPVGSLVELSTGEVGVIIAQNRTRRLRPKVLLVLNEEKAPLGCMVTRDLFLETEDDKGRPLDIKRGLERGAFGIDPNEFYM